MDYAFGPGSPVRPAFESAASLASTNGTGLRYARCSFLRRKKRRDMRLIEQADTDAKALLQLRGLQKRP